MIDQDKFGKFIAELRKEAGLTQEELAAKVYVGREAVSKWERGVGLPSHSILLLLSKEFDITINELLYGERITKTNKEEVEEVPYKWIDKIYDKLKRFKKLFIFTILILIIVYLISYFIFDYTSFKIYATYTSGGSFTIKPGLIVKCHDKVYFKFGNIFNYTDEEIKDMSLYYESKDEENRIKLLSGSELEDTVMDIKEIESLTNKKLKESINNLYIEITTESEVEQYKVEVDLNFKSNILSKMLNKDYKENTTDVNSNINTNEDKIKSKFILKEGEYVYEFKYKGKKYKCVLRENMIHMMNDNIVIKHRINSDTINIFEGTKKLSYNVVLNKCESGNCDKYKDLINIFSKNVLN